MTETTQTYTEPVAGLMRLGDVRQQSEWRDYLTMGFTQAHVPELCRMILDEDLFWADSESDEVWSTIHAWRTLAQLKAESAIPSLIELLGQIDDNDDDWTSEELPVVFGHIGGAAVEPLRVFLADSDQGRWSRTAASRSLVKIAEGDPEQRVRCVTIIGRQLEDFAQQDPTFNSFLIGDLIDLQGIEAASIIEQAFAADQVDLMMQGDWEEVQISLGLLEERITPPPDYREIMAAQMGFDPADLLNNFKAESPARQQRKAERQAQANAKAKSRAKRKRAKKSSKKQRKRKK